ncbi:MAG: hypothetical protein JWQ27_241 [Ferruginibacter sp.]|nr:hypothetical protein [Ferruginibacter sp.]
MIIDFIVYVISKCFKGYFYTISILSICLVVVLSALIKFILSRLNPSFLQQESVKEIFQLSIFLFVPLFFILIFKKYKYNEILKEELKVNNINTTASIIITVLMLILSAVLFTYTLMIW